MEQIPDQQGVILLTTKVQKWGNSLAVRIPNSIAKQVAFQQGSEIELSIDDQSIILKPKKKKPTLDDLLARITPENRHAEIDFGDAEGNEIL